VLSLVPLGVAEAISRRLSANYPAETLHRFLFFNPRPERPIRFPLAEQVAIQATATGGKAEARLLSDTPQLGAVAGGDPVAVRDQTGDLEDLGVEGEADSHAQRVADVQVVDRTAVRLVVREQLTKGFPA
jgi:hypothetical protein